MFSTTPEAAKVWISYTTCEVHVPVDDSQIRSNCSHWSAETAVLRCNSTIYVDQGEPIVIHHFVFAADAADISSWLQLLSYWFS